jgi:3-deoxy-manno-octulosonate cytidylyltransferase (CMP-KDO synthetase)
MNGELLALGVIPARANSSRFPLKVIAEILGKPMVGYVWDAARSCVLLNDVIVATDDESVRTTLEKRGMKVVMTPPELPTGTDRVAMVARESQAPLIINLQGDEPLLPSAAIGKLVTALRENPDIDMATLAVKKRDPHELANPNVVKVVTGTTGNALYFSRQPLATSPDGEFLKHVGIYAYRREALFRFCELPVSGLEKTEKLEQLRALENGFRIQVVLLEEDTIAVDVPGDIARVEAVMESFRKKDLRLE